MMALLKFVVTFVVLAYFGIQESHGCEVDFINCGVPIMAAVGKLDPITSFNQVAKVLCGAMDTGVACYNNVLTNDCRKPMTNATTRLADVTKEYKKECKNPKTPTKKQVESCDFKGYEECMDKLKGEKPTSDNVTKEICLTVGDFIECADDFTKDCQVNIFNQLVYVMKYAVTPFKDQCVAKGYPTSNGVTIRQMFVLPLLASVLAVTLRFF